MELTFEKQIETIKAEIYARIGPSAPIRTIGKEASLPAEKTIRNLKSQKLIPEDIFFKSPSGILIDTKKFLEWWSNRCSR